jgi:hypothetical protein
MANVNEGLEKAPSGEAVNTEAGFAAALAGKGVEPDETVASDTSIASGLETAEPAEARDPATGRFASKQTPAPADTSQTGADTSTETFTSDDPEVASFLAKYGGDPAKALQAAAQAQSLLGRQGQELGSMREQIAELRGMVTATQQAAPTPQALSDEDVQSLVQSQGYEAAATQLVNIGLATGNMRQYDELLEQWAAMDSPIQAQRFDLDFRLWKNQQEAAAATPAGAADPWVEQQKAASEMEATLKALASERGDQWAAIAPHMTAAVDSMPKAVGAMLTSDDAQERLDGARLVADRAILLAGVTPVTPEVQSEADAGMPESVRRKLLGAGVATGGLRPVQQAQGEEESREEAIKAFKRGILEAETTSVASGLTYGK